MQTYNIWNAQGLVQNNVPANEVAAMVQIDEVDIEAAIEEAGWCGAEDAKGERLLIVAGDDDASDLPPEAWAHISDEE